MKKRIIRLGKRVLERITLLSPTLSAYLLFAVRTKTIPHIRKPKTFNEKTTYLKLYMYPNNDMVIKCTDKYLVREYIKEKGLSNILNELYGVYDNFNEINFDKIPNQFVLKCNHGCAYNIICSDKNNFDINFAYKKVTNWMNEKYGLATSELHYTKIIPKIIIEKYLCDNNGNMPLDYKFYCFNGKCKCILVCSEREKNLRLNYFDISWNELNYGKESWKSNKSIQKPKNLDKMIKISEKLAEGFPYVRIDLYNDNGKIIFGEMTFTPACCCAPYYSNYGNEELGKYIDLNKVR